MSSIRTAEKLIDAMRRVAAARIRASAAAALAARPFAEKLQHQLGSLVQNIRADGIDVAQAASRARHDAMAVLNGDVAIDESAQRALMDQMYIALLAVDEPQPERDTPSLPTSFETKRAPPQDATVTLLTVFTSDRGFCGSYNKDVLTRAVRRIHDLQNSHPQRKVELILLGRTAINFFARNYPHLPVRYAEETGSPASATDTSAKVCDALLSEFIAGGIERVEVVYGRFVSLISNTPSVRTLLPVTPLGLEVHDDEIHDLSTREGKLCTVPVTEPNQPIWSNADVPDYALTADDAILLINALLPMYVHSQIVRMLREAIASELACRMTAMQAATDNCRDIARDLKTRYHKERQTQITNEIIMVAGFPREQR